MVDDDSRLSGVDESSQSGTSFPEGGTSLQNAVLYHARERAKRQSENPPRQPPLINLPLPEKIDDAKKVDVVFPDFEVEDRIAKYSLELDNYQVRRCARAQDYIKTFMRANALLNGRSKVTLSDLFLYDLVHPLFLNSMGELGTENHILSLIKKSPEKPYKEIIKMSGLSKGTFYKYKRILQRKVAV